MPRDAARQVIRETELGGTTENQQLVEYQMGDRWIWRWI
jgi:hypothetical protein